MGRPRILPEIVIGSVHNKWTVLETNIQHNGRSRCRVRCECGNEKLVADNALLKGTSRSCQSCAGRYRAKNPLVVGKKYGFWTVMVPYIREEGVHHTKCICMCVCGYESVLVADSIIHGHSTACRSCGASSRSTKHGDSTTPEYIAWTGMRSRCNNPESTGYENYGGRGIRVCARWNAPGAAGYMAFLEDMGRRPSPEHSIERRDVNGNYEPENVYWATLDVQANNKRNTIYLSLDGVTRTLRDWSRISGIDANVIRGRVLMGWDMHRAIYEPVR